MNKLVLVALKFAPVHCAHMHGYRDAFVRSRGPAEICWIVADEYRDRLPLGDRVVAVGPGRRYSDIIRGLVTQQRVLSRLTREDLFATPLPKDPVHVLVQATHPANPVLMKKVRHIFPYASIRYYLHEPTSWIEKVRRRNGLLASTAVYLAQWRDLRRVDLYYVANQQALEMAGESFPIASLANRGYVLPLPFRDLCPHFLGHPGNGTRSQILMMGRADNRRCLDLFLRVAAESACRRLHWRFTVLSASAPRLPGWAQALPNLRLRIGQPYSDEEMGVELGQSRFVFNLYRVEYTASGVTPVALMFGVPVVAREKEWDPELEAAGCLYLPRIPTAAQLVDRLEASPAADRLALRAFYERTFDTSAIAIP